MSPEKKGTSNRSRTRKRSTPTSAKAVTAKAVRKEKEAEQKKPHAEPEPTDAAQAETASANGRAKAKPRKTTSTSASGNGSKPTSSRKTRKKSTAAKGAKRASVRTPSVVKPKIFVLDTNVLLHDPTAIYRFEENDLVIPITVLEEVDRFKKGPDTINFHARQVARALDELAPDVGITSEEGVPLGDGRGRLRVIVGGPLHESVSETFLQESPDHRILSAACKIRDMHPDREVALVSKDVSLRLKARSLNLQADDYQNDKVPELDQLYTGREELEHLDGNLIDLFYKKPFSVPLEEFDINDPLPNQYFVLKGGGRSALVRYVQSEGSLVRIEKRSGYGIMPRNSEQTFAMDAQTDPAIQLVTLSGKAGTGKTLLALAGALEVRRRYEQVYLARPVVPLGQQELGYLPGDIEEKLDPYMQPLWDNLTVIRSQFKHTDPNYQKIQQMLETNKLNISALAYIRGRSLNRVFFIVDEAQNLTGHEVKTIITRAGEGTKIVLTGDPQQIDSPYLDSRSNGLTRLIDRMKGQAIHAHVTLEKGERSELSDLAAALL